jgi:hypothetical protein
VHGGGGRDERQKDKEPVKASERGTAIKRDRETCISKSEEEREREGERESGRKVARELRERERERERER